ncbi:putative LRR receptor-like serine/threonine-protein kinase RKF3 [Sesamum alatum]|uniref:LRR receptor-like serine/threonine-protein kinase RKF3 n=1 Tax=Sesamum alatum TaxID=300844 RepID=A0AAE2CDK0_9LAMI|nr:putative LRR receptor-like serine/threonine-protein kinase RKF3 [Sesamum alatum]
MCRFIFVLLFLLSLSQLLIAPSLSLSPRRTLLQNGTVSSTCPLQFDVLRRLAPDSKRPNLDTRSECQYIRQGLRLVQSEYLRLTNSFLPPPDSAESCWDAYESLVNEYVSNFNIRTRCGFQTPWIARGCMNITTRSEFEVAVPPSALDHVAAACNQSLLNGSPCASCTTALSSIQASYLPGPSIGNVSDCTAYPFIYAAAFSNHFGPTDEGTAKCLFNLDFTSSNSSSKKKKIVISVVVVVCGVVLLLGFSGFWFLRRKRARISRRKWNNMKTDTNVSSGLDSISASTTLIRFTFDEIKAATKNFSRENIIGKGGYGNVYKGVLPDGSEVALKRFKNCSAAGDASFTHEVEVIASVRHVNLVALRGYCTATTPLEVTDWAWSFVRKGRAMDVVEEGMPDLGPPEVVEKYVLVALLCSHPQLYARPTMDQVVKMLDMDVPVPSIPERPLSLIANIDDIERSVSSSGSGHLSTPAGYQPYTFEQQDHPEKRNEDDENHSGR